MNPGYSAATSGISWIDKKKFSSHSFLDEDLSGAGFKKYFPTKAEYFYAYRCEQCECVLIDYSRKYSGSVPCVVKIKE